MGLSSDEKFMREHIHRQKGEINDLRDGFGNDYRIEPIAVARVDAHEVLCDYEVWEGGTKLATCPEAATAQRLVNALKLVRGLKAMGAIL